MVQLLYYGVEPRRLDRLGDSLLYVVAGMGPESAFFMPVLLRTEAKLDINVQNTYLDTPLTIAVLSDDFEAAQLLLEHGANVNTKTEFGQDAIQIAVRRRRMDMVDLLLSYGADLDFGPQGDVDTMHKYESPNEGLPEMPEPGVKIESGNSERETGWIYVVDGVSD